MPFNNRNNYSGINAGELELILVALRLASNELQYKILLLNQNMCCFQACGIVKPRIRFAGSFDFNSGT